MAIEASTETSEPRLARLRLPEGLPQISPKWLKAFTLLWLAMFGVAVVAPLASTYLAYQAETQPAWMPLGISVDASDSLRIGGLHSGEARSSGLKIDDRVLAMDGRSVADASTRQMSDWARVGEGAAITFRVEQENGPPREIILTRRASHKDEYYLGSGVSAKVHLAVRQFSSLLASISLIVAAALLFPRRREIVAAILSLALLLISCTFLGTGSFWQHINAEGIVQWLGNAAWCALILVLLVFPSGRFSSRWTVVISLFLPLWWAVTSSGAVSWVVDNLGYITLLGVGVLSLTLRYRKLPAGAERQQLRWVFLGFATGTAAIATAITSMMILTPLGALDSRWWVRGDVILSPLLALGLVAYAGGLLVSMLRYRLYDADAVISRSAGYAVLTVLLAGTFAASAKAMEIAFEVYFGKEAGALPGAIGAGLAVVLITPLNSRIQGWAERRFQKALMALRRDLPECVSDLRETSPLPELLAEVVGRLSHGVRATRGAFLIRGKVALAQGIELEEAQWRVERLALNPDAGSLTWDRADGVFPVRIPLRARHNHGEPVGWLLLGPRPDGSLYGKDEQEVLAELSDPIARAVHIVLQREEAQARQEARHARQEARYTRQEQRVAVLEGHILKLTQKRPRAKTA